MLGAALTLYLVSTYNMRTSDKILVLLGIPVISFLVLLFFLWTSELLSVSYSSRHLTFRDVDYSVMGAQLRPVLLFVNGLSLFFFFLLLLYMLLQKIFRTSSFQKGIFYTIAIAYGIYFTLQLFTKLYPNLVNNNPFTALTWLLN